MPLVVRLRDTAHRTGAWRQCQRLGCYNTALEDVNGDLVVDQILHFPTESTSLAPGDTQACIKGELFDGTPFKGCDSVRIVQ